MLLFGEDYLFHYNEWSQVDFMLYQTLLEAADGCYEFVDEYEYRYHDYTRRLHKLIFRIVPHPHCLDRMIKKNYYKENKSLGPLLDFEFGYLGYDTPLKDRIEEIKREQGL